MSLAQGNEKTQTQFSLFYSKCKIDTILNLYKS